MAEPAPQGKILLKVSSIGDILVELWPKECPKACRNFVQLCMEGYYDGCVFHRLIPGFLVQGGDPTGTGTGGESIYDEGTFEDEISQRLRFNRRGLLAMANMGQRHTNASQFFFTLDRADNLYGHNTLFGCVTGDTLFNLLKFNELEVDQVDERPLFPPTIKSTEVLDNPFPDIVPRITAKERKEQADARKEMRKSRSKDQKRGKAIKNAGLLSFAEEEEAAQVLAAAKPGSKGGIKSAHDLLTDSSLSKEVKDDRGISSTLPETFKNLPSASAPKPSEPKPKKTKEAFEYVKPEASTSKSKEDEELKAQIASVSASLKAMKKKRRGSESDAEESAAKKAKTKPAIDGAALLTAQRNQYLQSGKAALKGGFANDNGIKSFREEIKLARRQAEEEAKTKPKVEDVGYAGQILEEDDASDENDMSFMSHKLKFRKDVTMERAQRDDYVTIDPREQGMTLEDAKHEEDRRRRKGQVPGQKVPRERQDDDRPRKDRGGARSRGYEKNSGEVRDWRGQQRE